MLRLEWLPKSPLKKVLNNQKAVLREKKLLTLQYFLWNERLLFQTWKDGNISQSHLKRRFPLNLWKFLKYWLLSAKWHVICLFTCQNAQNSLKMLRTLRRNCVLNLVVLLPFLSLEICHILNYFCKNLLLTFRISSMKSISLRRLNG